jgi:hypothetical protein
VPVSFTNGTPTTSRSNARVASTSSEQITTISFGRSRRVVSDAQFERPVVRDHGCRLGVGCSIPASACEAHHVIHWPGGGNTDDDELILTCWHDHRRAHEERWSIEPLGAGRFEVTRPDGDHVTIRPPLVGLALPEPRLPV